MRSDINLFDMFHIPTVLMIPMLGHMSLMSAEVTFSDPAMQAILNGKETYDAVVIESFFTDSLQGIGYKLNAPTILLTAFGPGILTNYLGANPDIYSHMPHPFTGYSQNMNFCERVCNYMTAMLHSLFNKFYYLSQQEKILHKFVPDAPSLHELKANISLQLFNSDPAINGPMPLLPNLIEVGGLHIQPPKKLPDDLQKFLDESKDGVIYFSLGGNLKSKDLPQGRREEFLRVLSKLKQKVLWKFEADDLPGKPANVEIRKWLPQQDILGEILIYLFYIN